MVSKITFKGKSYNTDLSKPIDISIPLRAGEENVNAWYVSPVKIEAVRMGDWVGDVNEGGSVNFRNITFNPHGNGTHTECVGHISKENYSVNQCLKTFFFMAELVTILPDELENGDKIITKEHIVNCLGDKRPEALVIRTLDNHISKINKHYSNSNPPYIHHEAMELIDSLGIDHLLIDLPSVDKEVDGGKLLSHHIFWNYPENTKTQRTITEMIYVPNTIFDGGYLLNLQIASFENDASPSKPVLYQLNLAL
ncbi:MAG: cyclase family protein [Bacteroidota bacterium]|jgi:kynurenine formamidase|nr:cyclase family protein [Bacteroidota bacterium]